MASVAEPRADTQLAKAWTAADLFEQFGPIPLYRVRFDPLPGLATLDDWIEVHDHDDRLCELVDGTLLEKTMSWYESYLALALAQVLVAFVKEHKLGIVLGADGPVRLVPEMIRMPDVAFLSWQRLPRGEFPRERWLDLAPDLAVEVVSKKNTRKEMDRKLADYFAAGVRMVWYVYPTKREVHVYVAPEKCTVLIEQQTLDGGDVLPGFSLALKDLFAEPKP
jgi:Uma2 family endonuclease